MFCACGAEEENTATEKSTESEATTEPVLEEEKVTIAENSYNIEEAVVGIFEIGKVVPDPLPEGLKIRQFIETSTDEHGKTVEYTHNVIFNQLEDVVELIMEKNQEINHTDKAIEEMMVLSNYYETPEGITVGKTIEEFKETYPDMSVWYDKANKCYLLETEKVPGAQFIFSDLDIAKRAKGSGEHQRLDATYIRKGAKIEKIRVH